jgi:hypothetical protein
MGDGEPGGGDARYHPPRGWDVFGPDTADGELAAAAMEWIAGNIGFLYGEAGKRRVAGDLWSEADAVSLVAYRAAAGGGIVHSLRRHAKGDLIVNDRALLLGYLKGAVGELRRKDRIQAERMLGAPLGDDVVDGHTTESRALSAPDPEAESDAFYSRVLEILAADVDRVSRSPRPTTPDTVRRTLVYLDGREEALYRILRRYAPTEVHELVGMWLFALDRISYSNSCQQ